MNPVERHSEVVMPPGGRALGMRARLRVLEGAPVPAPEEQEGRQDGPDRSGGSRSDRARSLASGERPIATGAARRKSEDAIRKRRNPVQRNMCTCVMKSSARVTARPRVRFRVGAPIRRQNSTTDRMKNGAENIRLTKPAT